jgi:hypothetical protein
VAAVRSAGESVRGRGGRGHHGRGGGRQSVVPEASQEARLAAGLCIKHWRYYKQANSCEQSCSWHGNCGAGGQLNAVVPDDLLRVTDTIAGLQFLVNTGAAFSCIPPTTQLPGSEELPRLKAAGGQCIQCFGEVTAEVCFGGRRFKWTFLLAAVEEPLLGGDFLKYYKLVVDLANRCLVDASNLQCVVVSDLATACGLAALSSPPKPPPQLRSLLEQFPDVLRAEGKLPAVKHQVEHSIVTTGRPTRVKFRRLDATKLAAAKKEFLQLEADGIIRRS